MRCKFVIWIILIAVVVLFIYYIKRNSERTALIQSSMRHMYDCDAQQKFLDEEIANLSQLVEIGNITTEEFDKVLAKIQARQNEIEEKFNIADKELEDADNILPVVASVLFSNKKAP